MILPIYEELHCRWQIVSCVYYAISGKWRWSLLIILYALSKGVCCFWYKVYHTENRKGVSLITHQTFYTKTFFFIFSDSSRFIIQLKTYQKLIMLDINCVIFDTLFDSYSSGITTHSFLECAIILLYIYVVLPIMKMKKIQFLSSYFRFLKYWDTMSICMFDFQKDFGQPMLWLALELLLKLYYFLWLLNLLAHWVFSLLLWSTKEILLIQASLLD